MNYREEMLRTCGKRTPVDSLLNGALGLCGEAGELADQIKKIVFHGHARDTDKLINELGDVRWYMELLCSELGTTMEEVERRNVEKLRKRYPNGFSEKDSVGRADVQMELPYCGDV